MGLGETRLLKNFKDNSKNTEFIIKTVYEALKEKGYDPINQMIGYIISGDPTYVTSHNDARILISSLDRDTILEELLKTYLGLED